MHDTAPELALVPERLRQARAKLGLSQSRLSQEAGLDRTICRRIEAGVLPSLETVLRLARVLGTAEAGLPTVIMFLNAYHPPLPSAARCYALGRALRELFADRPERVVLLIIGALFDHMAPVLWVIAVLGNLTVVHRMVFTYQEAKRLEEAQLRPPAARVAERGR